MHKRQRKRESRLLREVVNCGKVIRKCIVNKGCLVRVIMQIQVILGVSQVLLFSSFCFGRGGHLYKGKLNLCPTFRPKCGGQIAPPVFALS